MKQRTQWLITGGRHLLALLLLWIFCTPTVWAQDTPATRNKDSLELETIKVTARKHEENLQDVPAAITVFTDIAIENAGIKDLKEITLQTPNVSMRSNGTENFVQIRGISIPHTSLAGPTPVYVDDVVMPNPYMGNPALFDIEQVEVLKGPQGTLYGRNSEAGVIQIITRQPGNELSGKISGTWGQYNALSTTASVCGPIINNQLYFGLAGQVSNSDGPVKNVYNNDKKALKESTSALRPTLRWTPSQIIRILFYPSGFNDLRKCIQGIPDRWIQLCHGRVPG